MKPCNRKTKISVTMSQEVVAAVRSKAVSESRTFSGMLNVLLARAVCTPVQNAE